MLFVAEDLPVVVCLFIADVLRKQAIQKHISEHHEQLGPEVVALQTEPEIQTGAYKDAKYRAEKQLNGKLAKRYLFHVFHPLKSIERSDFMPDQCRQKRKEGEKTPFLPFYYSDFRSVSQYRI